MKPGLSHGLIGPKTVHVCVDMQRLFGKGMPWEVRWMDRILPAVELLCAHQPRRTIFTRFIPPHAPAHAQGGWRRYYDVWENVTLGRLAPEAIDLVPPLRRFVPPARIVDKSVYSPWMEGKLDGLRAEGVDTVVTSGGETDVCVLATALGSIDSGYRTILAADALCSSSDQTHDDLMDFYYNRFSLQLEVATTAQILANWPQGAEEQVGNLD